MGYIVVGVDARDEPIDLAKGLKLAPDLVLDARDGVESAAEKIAALNPDKPYPGKALLAFEQLERATDYEYPRTRRVYCGY